MILIVYVEIIRESQNFDIKDLKQKNMKDDPLTKILEECSIRLIGQINLKLLDTCRLSVDIHWLIVFNQVRFYGERDIFPALKKVSLNRPFARKIPH